MNMEQIHHYKVQSLENLDQGMQEIYRMYE